MFLSEIIMGMVQVVPSLVKEHFLSKHEEDVGYPLLKLICNSILESNDVGI
jgi:hypothetical protein